MAIVGLFFGSDTGNTEAVGKMIQKKLGKKMVDVKDIAKSTKEEIAEFDLLILGIPTWYYGENQCDWDDFLPDLEEVDFTDKLVAIFGLGDQLGYAEWFQDAVGMLHDELLILGCDVVGYWPNQGYEFDASKALTEDKSFFVGLCLDDENQYDLTDERINNWCNQLIAEIKLL